MIALKTPEQGAATSVLLAAAPELEGVGGRYYEDCAEAEVVERRGMGKRWRRALRAGPDNADRLWALSEQTLGATVWAELIHSWRAMSAAVPRRGHRPHALHRQAHPGRPLRSRRAGRLRDGDDALRRLVTIPISHYCEKARWALERAALDYREERHVQGVHQFASRRAGGSRHAAGARHRARRLRRLGVDRPLRRPPPRAGAPVVHRRPGGRGALA